MSGVREEEARREKGIRREREMVSRVQFGRSRLNGMEMQPSEKDENGTG